MERDRRVHARYPILQFQNNEIMCLHSEWARDYAK